MEKKKQNTNLNIIRPMDSSLPQTLEQLLSDTDSELFQDYQHYLEQSFCCENLYFWLDVQEYNELCEQLEHDDEGFHYLQEQVATQLGPTHQVLFHVLQQKCHAMIDTYIRPNSNQEINIPCELRQELFDQIFTVGNYHPRIFTRILKSVVELMRVNAFIPWISSYTTSSSPLSMSPRSPCLSTGSTSTCTTTTTTTTTQAQLQPTSPTTCQPPTNSSSNNGLSFSFVVDRWYSLNSKSRPLCRSDSMDSTTSMDMMVDDHDNHHRINLDLTCTVSSSSPPPSPTILSSPPASTRYRSMLQRVKHSFLPHPSTIKYSGSWKKDQTL
ncbi:RGS domain-containing protein [Chlamydoabsidia padenii]|nr:RGS domain-containing protein [Chlamydoabsidia padenii]